ncbi:MAG: hypothetical protein JW774_11485 [Candidatus Aureabacteria bacterium]|nr:hypothetical protein [Candidatus Auribacterota bacterium]
MIVPCLFKGFFFPAWKQSPSKPTRTDRLRGPAPSFHLESCFVPDDKSA